MTAVAITIKRALISVSDKTGVVEFAQQLQQWNVDILSTGGTAKLLRDNNITVTEVSDYTGFPEIMAGRVKTLHPKIHGGLLRRIGIDDDVIKQHGISPIDLLVINLYPFSATIAKPDCTLDDAIENIDIGGPAMLRAACKNYYAVTVASSAEDYQIILADMAQQQGKVSYATRQQLAAKGFTLTAGYDATVAGYLNTIVNSSIQQMPQQFVANYQKKQDLRYGENPHQAAAFYTSQPPLAGTIASAKQMQGKALSYNNIADADAALSCVKAFQQTACVIVKHANPCGVAVAQDTLSAYQQAFAADPTSAFGGIIAFNKLLDAKTAQAILDKQFVEVIIAPQISADAVKIFASKPNIRLLACGDWPPQQNTVMLKHIESGLLLQTDDKLDHLAEQLQVVTKKQPTEKQWQDLQFAWTVARFVKSNAIVLVSNQATIGIGAGQMSRVVSTKIACMKAEEEGFTTQDAVMASDAFFPFADSIENAKQAGIAAIIQPGGSIRDNEVIQAADAAGITMVFTGIRHFRH